MLYINILDTYFTINKKPRIMEINNTYSDLGTCLASFIPAQTTKLVSYKCIIYIIINFKYS